jgi:hypothetical protein
VWKAPEIVAWIKVVRAGKLDIIPWDARRVSNIHVDDVYRRLAQVGVTVAAVDNAYHFALQWVPSKDWTTDRVKKVLAKARTGTTPSRLHPPNVDLFLRTVDLPWKTTTLSLDWFGKPISAFHVQKDGFMDLSIMYTCVATRLQWEHLSPDLLIKHSR